MAYTFDFQAYIAEHKDPDARSRSFAVGDYAFRQDVKWLRTLHGAAPVRVLLAGTGKLWVGWGRKAVLSDSTRATEKDAPRIYNIARNAARALEMPSAQVVITPHLKELPAAALGDDEETFVALHSETARSLDDSGLAFTIGRQLGHIQNGHVQYLTASFYADEIAGPVVKFAIKPGLLALTRWYRHATITADRAGLLACRSLDVATRHIVREALGDKRLHEDIDVDQVLADLESGDEDRVSALDNILQRSASLYQRIQALELFTQTRFWRDHIGDSEGGGMSLTEVDDSVWAMLKGDAGARSQEKE